MTHISADEVRHLAQLSNVQLSDEEVANLGKDITSILGYIEQLNELDTQDILPTYQVTNLENVWREDEVGKSTITREQLLALAPESQNHQVKVPKVL